ncbi:MAG: hypothetical protein OEY34_08940, partial [Cyclobacteriaceae bacterium]|nr:hypothetical protein [Cyclobacteriaceae bacterium]
FPNKCNIVFAQSSVNSTAYVIVTETAANGNTSAPDSITVTLNRYCPLDLAAYVGTAVATGDSFTTGTTNTLGTGANELILDGIMDAQVQGSWAETYDVGVGNEGSTHVVLNADGTVNIPSQHLGSTEGGTWVYWIRGSGTYSQCDRTMTLNYTFGDDVDDYYNRTVTLTMN